LCCGKHRETGSFGRPISPRHASFAKFVHQRAAQFTSSIRRNWRWFLDLSLRGCRPGLPPHRIGMFFPILGILSARKRALRKSKSVGRCRDMVLSGIWCLFPEPEFPRKASEILPRAASLFIHNTLGTTGCAVILSWLACLAKRLWWRTDHVTGRQWRLAIMEDVVTHKREYILIPLIVSVPFLLYNVWVSIYEKPVYTFSQIVEFSEGIMVATQDHPNSSPTNGIPRVSGGGFWAGTNGLIMTCVPIATNAAKPIGILIMMPQAIKQTMIVAAGFRDSYGVPAHYDPRTGLAYFGCLITLFIRHYTCSPVRTTQ
jgi:hypothetical protein